MSALVIYFCKNKPVWPPTLNHSSIWFGDKIVGYARTELHKNKDAAHALDDAKPKDNETVLNSVELH